MCITERQTTCRRIGTDAGNAAEVRGMAKIKGEKSVVPYTRKSSRPSDGGLPQHIHSNDKPLLSIAAT